MASVVVPFRGSDPKQRLAMGEAARRALAGAMLADVVGAATPVGPACAICPRMECPYRATPPAGRMLAVHENRKTISPFPFLPR